MMPTNTTLEELVSNFGYDIVTLTTAEARNMPYCAEEMDPLNDAFDKAQGDVFSGAVDASYILIKIAN